jgi:uncharacterized membrane protein YvlD (DUF360 family)
MQKKQSSSGSHDHEDKRYNIQVAEIIVDIIRAIVWPVLIIAGVIVFFNPLNLVVTGLATKISDANKVSLGGLSVEFEAKVRKLADPLLTSYIVSLSPQAIEQLLNTPFNVDVTLLSNLQPDGEKLGLPNEEKLNAFKELDKIGLLMFKEPLNPFINKIRKFARDPNNYKNDEHIYYIIPGGAMSEEYRNLADQRYHLTEKGEKASKAIVKALSELISKQGT